MTQSKIILGCFSWLLLVGCAYAQQTERAISPGSNFEYTYSNLPTQPVGPDDLLAVSVYDSPELTRTVRVEGKLGLKRVSLSPGNCPEKKNSSAGGASETTLKKQRVRGIDRLPRPING